jgi:hypothetical protein
MNRRTANVLPPTNQMLTGYWNRPRAVHLIDIENLVAGPLHIRDTARMLDLYRAAIGIQNGDQAILATSCYFAFELIGHDLHDVQFRITTGGPDAADQLLVDSINIDYLARRFQTLFIASNDQYFIDVARQARGAGMTVWQVSGRDHQPNRLRRECTHRAKLNISAMYRLAARHPNVAA